MEQGCYCQAPAPGSNFICMVTEELVRHEIVLTLSYLLAAAQVMQSAVCPEVRLGLDSAVSAIASVTEVELSKDMQVIVIN